METGIIKPIIRVGNSAGVLVPKDWINGRARVELIQKPLNIERDMMEILSPYLKDIIGVYLIGSYARREQTERSDVDVLVITSEKSGRIKKEKYDILLITKNEVDRAIKDNALPIIPMLKEAKPIINKKIIEEYEKVKLSKKNLIGYFDITKSGLALSKASITVDKETGSQYSSDAVSYSLVLNLRSTYLVDCIKNGKKWSNKEFLKMVKNISGSLKAYGGYLRVKDDKSMKEKLPIEEAEKLYNYVLKKIKEHEKWVRAKKEEKNQ